MVKKREPSKEVNKQDLEAFASAADSDVVVLDPNAKRDHLKFNVGLNAYEQKIIDEAAAKAGRSRVNFVRYAAMKLAEEMEK